MPESPPISVDKLSKRYGEGPLILKDISLTANKGEIITIVGPSGCGKSTFLRLLAGLSSPTSGHIQIALSQERPAFIFQDPTLLPWANALENVALPLRLQGADKTKRLKIAGHWLERLGLKQQATAYPRQLSGGMQMRVSIARALALQPDLLLLDEPFAALDALSRNHLNEILLGLHQQQLWNAFFVTHSVSEAVFLAHRILVLSSEGRLLEIIQNPLPFPRMASVRESRPFQDLVGRITGQLQRILPHD